MAERYVSPQDEAAGRDVKTFHVLADVIRRRKKEIFLPALAVFALAAVVAFALPRTYKSTATLLVAGLALGMGSGVILAAVRESGDDTVRSPRDLGKIARGLPVLASVPVIATAADDGLRKRRTMKFAAATAVVLAAGVLIFHFFVFNLDAAWAMVVRKLSA